MKVCTGMEQAESLIVSLDFYMEVCVVHQP